MRWRAVKWGKNLPAGNLPRVFLLHVDLLEWNLEIFGVNSCDNLLKIIDPARLVDEAFAGLGHKKDIIRNRAVRALTAIGGRQVVDRSIDALSDENIDIRRCAAYVLGNISAERAEPRLIDLLNDKDEGVRRAASYALYAIESIGFTNWTPLSGQS